MILDHIDNAERYYSTHPGFKAAFEWLRAQAGHRLPAGKTAIQGAALYANVIAENGRGLARARFEAHLKYIDIQYVVEGGDVMGWRYLEPARRGQGYNADKDVAFLEEKPELWLPVQAGHFAVFFPEDAHAPMAGDGPMYKLVAKVAV